MAPAPMTQIRILGKLEAACFLSIGSLNDEGLPLRGRHGLKALDLGRKPGGARAETE